MKKFLCMMMAVLMVLAMAACGGEPANNGGNDAPDATTVKIGGIGPLTGAYANYGLSEKNGAELAVKEINEAAALPASRSNSAIRIPRASPKALSMPMAS